MVFIAVLQKYSTVLTVNSTKMKTFGITLLLILSSAKSFGQDIAHGPSIKASYGTLEKFAFGVGYNFVKYQDSWGWIRPAHNYYFEYLPEFKAFGVSANVQYTIIALKAGMEVSFRSKNENNQQYFSFYPHMGFDLLNLDLSFGPEISTIRNNNRYVGFKVSIKVHPKLFNMGATQVEFKRPSATTN